MIKRTMFTVDEIVFNYYVNRKFIVCLGRLACAKMSVCVCVCEYVLVFVQSVGHQPISIVLLFIVHRK